MRLTRASIDRKLDVLVNRTAAARQDAIRRTAAVTMAGAALAAVWWWRAHRVPQRSRNAIA